MINTGRQRVTLSSKALDSPLLAISLKTASVVLFVVMSIFVKAAGDLPAGQLLFFRFLFGLLPIVTFLTWRGQLSQCFKTQNISGHVWRGLVGAVGMALMFYSLAVLPLAQAIVLGYAMPFFVVVFGATIFGESVRKLEWSSVSIGLCGVLIICLPDVLLASVEPVPSLARTKGIFAGLVGAVISAWAMMLVKQLVRSERSTTIVIWFSCTSTGFAAMSAFWWRPMDLQSVASLLAAGILGGVAQILMTESYRYARASIIAPFEYLSVIFSLLLGFMVFGDVPTGYVLVGGAIVLLSGLMTGIAELRASRNRMSRDRVAELSVTPVASASGSGAPGSVE